MANIIKPIAAEIAAPLTGFATDLNGIKVFRVVNTDTSPQKISITTAADALVGDITIVSGGSLMLFKSPTEKVFGSAITLLLSQLAPTIG